MTNYFSSLPLNGWIQFGLFLAVLLLVVKPLGLAMSCVLQGKYGVLGRVLRPIELGFYRIAGVNPQAEMSWQRYSASVLLFSVIGFAAVYALQRMQNVLPLNPQGFGSVTPDSSMNTAISFVTNTNWQGYGGETTMSYLTQMLALGVQNFLSAAMGIAVLAALIRGLARRHSKTIGNFWVDMTRSTLFVLLPLSALLAVILVSQGVVQTFKPYAEVKLVEPLIAPDGTTVTMQTLPMGPAASQIAIKQLGTNGGGFFNVNSAHPFENPTTLSNFFQVLSILLIAASLCYTYGEMVGDRRQGWAVLAAMTIMFVPLFVLCATAEQAGNPRLSELGVDQAASAVQPGGNMEGKEARFGVTQSALWATATTAASNGSVNAMHDSFTPLGGLVPMWLMQLGEVIFGGVGSGLYGMVMFIVIAVFVAGLMVGRTPEYLGKKIEAFEVKMAALAILIPCTLVLVGTAIAIRHPSGLATMQESGPHGFSEVLYAFSSGSNNNGSAFAGLGANTPFYNGMLGLCMLIGRFGVMIPVLAMAGSLAAKNTVPASSGTLPTHTPLFVIMLIGAVIIVGALTFIPALALGPIVESLL